MYFFFLRCYHYLVNKDVNTCIYLRTKCTLFDFFISKVDVDVVMPGCQLMYDCPLVHVASELFFQRFPFPIKVK